jgi:GAF domain-containing protein
VADPRNDDLGAALDPHSLEPTTVVCDLWTLLQTSDDLGASLQRLVDVAGRLFPSGYEASITILARDDHPETVATTTSEVLPLDRAQYEAGTGPCLDAARTREPIRTDLDGARSLWPQFAAAAEAAGIYGYLSAPLLNDHAVIGSFNLYSRKPERFDDFDAALLTLFTNSALAAVANGQRHHRTTELVAQLRTALESRATINHAIGRLMERHQLTDEQAWTLLQRSSQNHNIKLRELANRIAHHGLRLEHLQDHQGSRS